MKTTLLAGAAALAFAAQPAFAEHQHQSHAPIGVMGDHLMRKGEWMAAYRYDLASQTGLRQGASAIDKHEVLETYGEAPLKMQMGMHMLEGMVGVTDNLTLMAMGQYMDMDMTHQAHPMPGMPAHMHEMEMEGLGDTQVTGVYQLMHRMDDQSMQSLLLNAGASLPTGSIDKSYLNHHGTLRHLPYGMQYGSGTVDPLLGLTYTGMAAGGWNWGTQLQGTFRFYDNGNDYHLGNRYTLNLWAGKELTDTVEASLRLEGMHWGDVNGADPMIPATSMSGATPGLTGGEQVNAYLGFGFTPPVKALESSKLALEFGAPIYQRFDGPQLETDYRLILGWQVGF